MTHTRPVTLVGLALVALVAGFVLDAALVASGRPVLVPPPALGLALLAIGAVVVSLAVPVRRVARGDQGRRVDAYYATRVLLLAKASSLSGAIFAGLAGGVLTFVLTRGVSVALGSLVPTIVAVVGGVALLVAGVVAERMCTVPPDDDAPDGAGHQAV